ALARCRAQRCRYVCCADQRACCHPLALLASATNPSRLMLSGRSPGSTPAAAICSLSSQDLSALLTTLRRWVKACATSCRSSATSVAGCGSVDQGVRRTTAESTLGGGENAEGGTKN